MNWIRLALDALIMAAYFNAFAVAVMCYNPRLMLPGFPKSIQKAAPPTARERRLHNAGMSLGVLVPLMVYSTASAVSSGVTGFASLFFTFYAEWLAVSLADFFLLDIVLFKKMKARIIIPGTAGHPDYATKNWMRKLALPEHLIGWPLLFAPVLAALQAVVGGRIG